MAGQRIKAALAGTSQQLGHPFSGKLRLHRNFNLPTGLDEDSVVWLCTEGLPLNAKPKLFLNRQPLDRTDGRAIAHQMEIAVTDILENFNRIEVELSCFGDATPVKILEDATSMTVQASVWLEIE